MCVCDACVGLSEWDDYNTMERRVAKWWRQQEFVVAQGDGLFTHERVDGVRAGQVGCVGMCGRRRRVYMCETERQRDLKRVVSALG